jgi:molybdopterin molybdotransferase
VSEVSVLLSVDEAVGRVLLAFSPLETVRVPLSDCYGLVLSEDVLAKHDVPIDDNSAYDGYGVRADDIAAAAADNPIRLRVAYDLAAGYVGDAPIGPGEAVRIMTGAPVPEGVDTVIGFEDTDREDWGKLGTDPRGDSDQDRAFVNVVGVEQKGENVRLAGEDIATGDVALPKGTVLRAGAIGVLASLGISQVPVHRRPRVGVVPTGDEVLEIDEDIQPGKVRNSHAWALAGLVDHYGAEAKRYPIVPDNVADVRAALALAASENDLIFTIGGVSMGDHDLVKNVVGTDGDADFWQIAMRPGKPLLFGDIDGTPILGLPGNPVSGLVVFEQFGRPAVLKMLGRDRLEKPTVSAVARTDLPGAGKRRMFVRVRVARVDDGYECWTTGEQGSGIMTSMAFADGLAIVHEDIEMVKAGEAVTVQILDWTELG